MKTATGARVLVELKHHAATCDLWRATQLAADVLRLAAVDPAPALVDFAEQVKGATIIVKSVPASKALQGVLALDPDDRRDLADAVANDITFHQNVDESRFRFAFPGLSETARACGTTFLRVFYVNLLKNGFKGLVCQDNKVLNIHVLERLYSDVNASVCPGCLVPQRDPVSDKSQVDRDHFFPKSLYPALSVHPCNLTLLCSACNSRVKVDRDPLLPGVDPRNLLSDEALEVRGKEGALRLTYVPFERSAQDELSVDIGRIPPVKTAFSVTLRPREDDPLAAERMRSLNWLFEVGQVWSGLLSNTVYAKVLTRSVRRLDRLEEALDEIVADAAPGRFREHTEFLMFSFAGWLRSDPARLQAWHDECAETRKEVRRTPGAGYTF